MHRLHNAAHLSVPKTGTQLLPRHYALCCGKQPFPRHGYGVPPRQNPHRVDGGEFGCRQLQPVSFSLDQTDAVSVTGAFEGSDYVYTCTAYFDDRKVEYTLGRGESLDFREKMHLTPAERKELERRAGNWCISSVSVLPEEENSLSERVRQISFEKYDQVIFVGSLSGFRYPVAVGFLNGQATDMITLQDDLAY